MLFLFFYTTMMLFFETGLTALLAGTGVPVGFGTGLGEQYRSSGARHTGLREGSTPRHATHARPPLLCCAALRRAGRDPQQQQSFGRAFSGGFGAGVRAGSRGEAAGRAVKRRRERWKQPLHCTPRRLRVRGGVVRGRHHALRPSFARSQRRGIGGEMKTAHASGAFRRHARLTCFGPIAACRPLTPPAARRVRRFWTCGGRQQGWPPRPGELIPTGYHAGAASQRRR
jgi:hypothetical protein